MQRILRSDIFITSRILRVLLLQYIARVNLLYVSFISSLPRRWNGSQQICYDPSRMLRVYEAETGNQSRPSIDVAGRFTPELWAILSLGLMFAQPLCDFITFWKHFINTLSSAMVESRKANKPWLHPPSYRLWSDNHPSSQNSEQRQKILVKIVFAFFQIFKNFDLTSAWNANQAGLEEEGDLLSLRSVILPSRWKGRKKEFYPKRLWNMKQRKAHELFNLWAGQNVLIQFMIIKPILCSICVWVCVRARFQKNNLCSRLASEGHTACRTKGEISARPKALMCEVALAEEIHISPHKPRKKKG